MSLSHQSKKRTTVDDNVSKYGNLYLHEEIIDTVNGERQSRQNTGLGKISQLVVGIKKFWTEESINNSLFKGYKDQLNVPENCKLHYYYKRNDKKYADM